MIKIPGPIVGACYGVREHRVTSYSGNKVHYFCHPKFAQSMGACELNDFVTRYPLARLPDWLVTGKYLYIPDTKRTIKIEKCVLGDSHVHLESYKRPMVEFLDDVSRGYYVKGEAPASEDTTRYFVRDKAIWITDTRHQSFMLMTAGLTTFPTRKEAEDELTRQQSRRWVVFKDGVFEVSRYFGIKDYYIVGFPNDRCDYKADSLFTTKAAAIDHAVTEYRKSLEDTK